MNEQDAASSPLSGRTASEGVVRLLRDHITARVAIQLDAESRKFSTIEAVADAVRSLAVRLNPAGYVPDLIVYWRDPEYTYRGSESVAKALGHELNVHTKGVEIREQGERRELIDDFSWMTGLSQVLVVDDACYSGSTLLAILKKCREAEPAADVRCAVLTALDPEKVPDLYYVYQHKAEDLLFPWGWSRAIKSFYDVYDFFGILDRRTVSRETATWGSLALIVEDFFGSVGLLELAPAASFDYAPGRDQDVFLYVVLGTVLVTIGAKSGVFERDQYLFVPREVAYSLNSEHGATVMQLASRNR